MRVERRHSYQVSVDVLKSVLTDRAFFESRFKDKGDGAFRFDAYEQTADGLLIRVHRDIEINIKKAPAMVRKFLGDSVTLVSEFLWAEDETPPYQARYLLKVINVPVEVRGQVCLLDEEQACQHITAQVSSSLPLIGGKLVRMVGQYMEQGFDADYRSTVRYLNSRGFVQD